MNVRLMPPVPLLYVPNCSRTGAPANGVRSSTACRQAWPLLRSVHSQVMSPLGQMPIT